MSLYGDLPPLPGDATAAAAATAPAASSSSSFAPRSVQRAPMMLQAVPRALAMAQKAATSGAQPVKTAAQTAALLAQVQQRIADQKAAQAAAAQAAQTSATLAASAPAAATSVPFYLSSRADSGVSPLVAAAAAAASVDDEATAGLFGLSAAQRALEYDPRFPNDYETYVSIRDKRRKEEKEAAEARRERERQRRRGDDSDDDREQQLPVVVIHPSGSSPHPSSSAHSASVSQWNAPAHSIPPVSSHSSSSGNGGNASKLDLSVSSGEEAYQRRLAMSRGAAPVQTQQAQPNHDSNKRARTEGPPSGSASAPAPSRVVLLLNMVGRGETDEGLEEETADECAKYGKVLKCTVFELPLSTGVTTVPDCEAVRIFVKFENIQAATGALAELEGRPFGGRIVRAKFYEEIIFNKGQLSA